MGKADAPGEYSLPGSRSSGPKGQPLFQRNERLQPVPFFFREDHVVQWSVRQIRFSRTEDGYDSYASRGTAEGETDHGISGAIPLPNPQEFFPAALLKEIIVLLQAQRALPLLLNGNGGKNNIRM